MISYKELKPQKEEKERKTKTRRLEQTKNGKTAITMEMLI